MARLALSNGLEAELQRLQPRMTAVALRVVRRPDIADDVVQSAYEKAVRKLDQFDGRSLFSTWLHRIVVNEGLMWLRSERRKGRKHVAGERFDPEQLPAEDALGSPQADAPTRMILEERRRALLRALARLPAAERTVIQRVALDGLSYEEFERETGIRPAAAKSRAFRGRRRLEHWLADAV